MSKNSSISNNSVKHKYKDYIYLTHRTLSGASTPGQSGPEIDCNKGVLRTTPSDCVVAYPGHARWGDLTPL